MVFDGTAVLCIPLYALSSESELKIIWHEVASLVVNPNNDAPSSIPQDPPLDQPHGLFTLFQTADHAIQCPAIPWRAYEARLPDSSLYRSFLDTRDPNAAEGWELFWLYWAHRMDPSAQDLRKMTQPDAVTHLDWRVAHLEELAEDACSTLAFGAEIYETLIGIFQDNYPDQFDSNGQIPEDLERPDWRHPAPSLRLEVTYWLLKHLKADFEPGESDPLVVQGRSRHGQIPGARELATWIHTNRNALIHHDSAD
ncbi:MAG: hypothetical protein IPK19_29185 [Chloroflexi bacterium]|nr:hypothetical protein [Chloroflexota bacterium]